MLLLHLASCVHVQTLGLKCEFSTLISNIALVPIWRWLVKVKSIKSLLEVKALIILSFLSQNMNSEYSGFFLKPLDAYIWRVVSKMLLVWNCGLNNFARHQMLLFLFFIFFSFYFRKKR